MGASASGGGGAEIAVHQSASTPAGGARRIAAPATLTPHEHQGITPAVDVSVQLSEGDGAASSTTVVVAIKNATGTATTLAHVIQIVDIEGADVVEPIVGEVLELADGMQATAASQALPELPDGYHQVLVTALSDAKDGDAHGGGGQTFLRVENGVAHVVDFAEWWAQSGASNVSGPVEDWQVQVEVTP